MGWAPMSGLPWVRSPPTHPPPAAPPPAPLPLPPLTPGGRALPVVHATFQLSGDVASFNRTSFRLGLARLLDELVVLVAPLH